MDILRFTNPTSPTKMEQAKIVNGLTSKMWIERYSNAGEFKLVGPVHAGLRDALPIGSFITHTDTYEIMIVENHEISDPGSNQPEIIITGRGLETFFENRAIRSGAYTAGGGGSRDQPLNQELSAVYVSEQAALLLRQSTRYANDSNDKLPYIMPYTTLPGIGPQILRTIPMGTVYERFLELLAANPTDPLGIKVIRPGPWNPLPASFIDLGFPITLPTVTVNPGSTCLLVHRGTDRTSTVSLSTDRGQILNAEYLWSNKSLKNYALVHGRYCSVAIALGTPIGIDRRMINLDASDLDDQLSAAPSAIDAAPIWAAMRQRGLDFLSSQKETAITKAEVNKTGTSAKYRVDYDLGDLITVHAQYNTTATMRVTEFVEIEDETGKTAYPTLSLI